MDIRVLNTPLPEDLLKLKWNGQFELMNQIKLTIQLEKVFR